MKFFELRDYYMEKPVQLQVSELAFEHPGVITVTGGSGIGKSCFFRSLVGLERAKFSRLAVKEQNLALDVAAVRSAIFYLPQVPLNDDKMVLEYFIEISKFNPNFHSGDFVLLRKLGLELFEKKISALSGGENQLVKMEIMLGLNPQVVVLDEAFTGLDMPKLELVNEVIRPWLKDKLVFNLHHMPTILDDLAIGEVKFSEEGIKGRML